MKTESKNKRDRERERKKVIFKIFIFHWENLVVFVVLDVNMDVFIIIKDFGLNLHIKNQGPQPKGRF